MTDEFNHVALLLQEPLSDEPETLIKDLEAIEVWNSRMQFLLAEANSKLDVELAVQLPRKEEGSELERKTLQLSRVSQFKEARNKIEGLCEAIKTRITLGQSILRYYSSTQNIQYKDNTKSLKEILGDEK